jgi:putative endonuclease
MAAHNDLGTWGEDLAAAFLRQKGYVIIERDWRLGHRDIDLIALDGDTMVFVEVKTRRNRVFGSPEEAVGYRKLRNLRSAIDFYVKSRRINYELRFDIVSIVGTPASDHPEIDHLKDVRVY